MTTLKLIKQARRPRFRNRKLFRCILDHAIVETGLAEMHGVADCEIGLIMVGPRTMRRLNRTHLGHDRITDVLAFDFWPDPLQCGGERCLAGEIYVCPAVAVETARRLGTATVDEIILYAVHGMLHLRGEDDRTPEATIRMRREEQRVMSTVQKAFPNRANAFAREDTSDHD